MSLLPPPPPPFFTSSTPGYSVVLPDEPKKSRELAVLLAVGCLAVVVIVVSAVSLARSSNRASTVEDSNAATTVSPTTSTTLLMTGEVEFLTTRSPVRPGDHGVDLSGLSVGQCFDLAPGGVVEQRDCGLAHFFQLYAVGEVPSDVTEASKVHQFYLGFCSSQFANFVGVAGVYSPFVASGTYPAEWQLPDYRTVRCYIYVPGEFGWTGTAEASGDFTP